MSLLVWLPMTKDLTQQGLSNVTVTNNGAIIDNNGKIGKCYYFDGNDHIRISLPSELTTIKNTTVCAWIKSTGSVIALGGISNDTNYANAMVTLYTSGWQFSGSGTYKYLSSGLTANNGTWHHVACTIDDTTITTYKDGAKVTSATLSSLGVAVTNTASANFIEIGCDHPGGDEYLTGYVNDFRIYNHCLSAKEIEILSRGLVAHYPLNGGGRGGTNLVADSYVNTTSSNYGFGGKSVNITEGKTYTVSVRGYISSAAVTSGTHLAVFFYKSDWSYCPAILQIYSTTPETKFATFTATQTTTLRITSYSFKSQGTAGDPVTAIWYKVEEGSASTPWMPNPIDPEYTAMGYDSTTEYDVSGYGNNGIKNGTIEYSSDTARYSVSTIFKNTSSNYITLSPINIDMTQVSFSVWFKINSAQKWARIFDFGTVAEGAGYAFGLALGNDGTTLTVYGRRGSSGATLPDKQVQSISLNTWYHAVVTLSNTTLKCYINGTLVIDTTITAAYPSSVAFALCYIGKSIFSADKLLDGTVSDFRAYATALSATQIAELYNTAVSVANNGALLGYELVEV